MGSNLTRALTLILIMILIPLTLQFSQGPINRSTVEAVTYTVCTYVNPTPDEGLAHGNFSVMPPSPGDGGLGVDGGILDITPVSVNYTLQAHVPVGYTFGDWKSSDIADVDINNTALPTTWVVFGTADWDGHCVGNLTVDYFPNVTITSSPATGPGFVTIDGAQQDTPYIVAWQYDTSHTISANTQVSCSSGCQFVWTKWSDTGSNISDQTHMITIPAVPTSYVAYFKTQYMLNMSANPNGCGYSRTRLWVVVGFGLELRLALTQRLAMGSRRGMALAADVFRHE